MKLASFMAGGRATWGAVVDDRVFDLGGVLGERLPGLRQVVEQGAYADAQAALGRAAAFAVAEVEWLPVIPDPGKILCIGLNYEDHRVEAGRDKTGHPAVFTRFADSQLGHGQPILRPKVSTALDYEGELAVVIGKGGRYIKAAEAMSHIAGYACYNDGTVRDWQRHTIQFTPGKNFPGTGGFGPWMVTPDEIDDITALRITTRVNGQVVQDAGFDQLIFPIATIIEYCSSFTPLSPGDVIATGTPGGVGFKRQPPLFLKPGDQVEVDIPGVGLLVNGVADDVG
jgi:2-keto-4-pentenoate hydratase/2-oxohepta-3-ene-1,7-dioic acid hydratase in catechol pathway